MKTSPYQTSSNNHPTQPQLTKVHNLVFHDSTGNHLDIDKLFNSSSTSVKKWAPYIDLATRYVRDFTITGHVVLVVGVRHLCQMMQKALSPSSFREKVQEFINSVKASNPAAKVVLCSILPDSDQKMIDGAAMFNSILQEFVNGGSITFADSISRLQSQPNAMRGYHPTKSHIGLLAMAIKEAMGRTRQVTAPRFANQRRNHGSSFRSNKGPVNAENKQQRQPSQQRHPSDRHALNTNPMDAKSDPVAQSNGLNNFSPSATMSASPMQHINGPQFMPWQMMNTNNAGNNANQWYGPPGYGPQRSNHLNHPGWYPNGLNHQLGQFW